MDGSSPATERRLVLGIDLGTTSVKVCLIDLVTHKCIKQMAKDTQANVPSELGSEGNKQYVPKIVSALHSCVSRMPREALRRVERVGVCGQMHGCVLWRSGKAWSRAPDTNTYELAEVSHLYTWQDTRCTPEFLASLPPPDSHLGIHSGYGVATLLWFLRHKPEKLQMYDRSGTVQDLVVAMLCELDAPVMSVQNAASWGYFNTATASWNADLLASAGLPAHLLPAVVAAGAVAGRLSHSWLGLPAGAAVTAALGDLQCSVLPLLPPAAGTDRAALNVSTSAQMSVLLPPYDSWCVMAVLLPPIHLLIPLCLMAVLPIVRLLVRMAVLLPGFVPPSAAAAGCISYLPYLEGRYLAVAAALTGGNALAAFVQMLQQWTQQLGFNVPQAAVWSKIISLAEGRSAADSTVRVVPTVRGERHAPHQRASVTGIDTANTDLGQLTVALCRGVADNLDSMMPRSWLADRGVSCLLGTGSALARNPALQRAFERTYGAPLQMAGEVSAAYGAALAAASYV